MGGEAGRSALCDAVSHTGENWKSINSRYSNVTVNRVVESGVRDIAWSYFDFRASCQQWSVYVGRLLIRSTGSRCRQLYWRGSMRHPTYWEESLGCNTFRSVWIHRWVASIRDQTSSKQPTVCMNSVLVLPIASYWWIEKLCISFVYKLCVIHAEQLMADTDLNGLDVIADDQQAVKAQRATVQRIATHTLTQGLQAMDRTKVIKLIWFISQLTLWMDLNFVYAPQCCLEETWFRILLYHLCTLTLLFIIII